jgi:molybdate transport system substrate-binding protein
MTDTPPKTVLTGISSMATRQLMGDLAAAFAQRSGCRVVIESVGGVDAARRVQAGEIFDVVMLASDAIDRLIASGHLGAGSRTDLFLSPVALAVREGAPPPDISTEDAVKQAFLAARSVGYSTGPSGTHLMKLIERWGLSASMAGRTVQAPAGVPVASLVARGEVDLGLQQRSELMHQSGIRVLGNLPPGAEFITTFSAGLCPGRRQAHVQTVQELLNFVTSPEAAASVRTHGMEPA